MAGDIGNKRDLLQISSKFTEETLVTILENASGTNNIKLIRYEIGDGSTRGGDSFLSTLSRLKIEGKINDRTFSVACVIKGLPANIGRRKTFRSTEFFFNEAAFYTEVYPKLIAFQESKKPKNPFLQIPDCYYALADGENDFIVLEDISTKGFITGNRLEGVDLDHSIAILQTLGRFHALSLAMKNQDPEGFNNIVNKLKETYFGHEYKIWYNGQLKRFREIVIDAVSKEYPNSIYEEKLKQFADEALYERIVEYVETKGTNAVIGHGDTWAPNFMFCYDSKSNIPQSVQIIDFQLARYGSPILDFSFFFFSCTTQELRASHFTHLTDAYYNSLADLLQDLGSNPHEVFSHKQFVQELSHYILFGLAFSFESVPFSIMDENEVPNLDLIEGDNAVPLENIWHVKPIKDKKGRLRLANNVKFAVDKGFL